MPTHPLSFQAASFPTFPPSPLSLIFANTMMGWVYNAPDDTPTWGRRIVAIVVTSTGLSLITCCLRMYVRVILISAMGAGWFGPPFTNPPLPLPLRRLSVLVPVSDPVVLLDDWAIIVSWVSIYRRRIYTQVPYQDDLT